MSRLRRSVTFAYRSVGSEAQIKALSALKFCFALSEEAVVTVPGSASRTIARSDGACKLGGNLSLAVRCRCVFAHFLWST